MPLYEYECNKCGKVIERLTTKIIDRSKEKMICECAGVLEPILSSYGKHGSWSDWQPGKGKYHG